MEDEKDDVGPGSDGGAIETPVRGNFPNETLVENMGSENRVEESYEEGDGGEIMVEVVGSDVFVDGVSSHKEGDFESREVGDLMGPVWKNKEETQTQNFSESMDLSTEGDGSKSGESDLGLSESRDGGNDVSKEEVTSLSESVDVEGGAVTALSSRGVHGLDDEGQKAGIEATAVCSSVATDSVTVQTKEIAKTINVVVSEEKAIDNESVNKDSVNFVTPETVDCSLEVGIDEKVGSAEKDETLPSNDNGASHDHSTLDSVVTHGSANEAHDDQIALAEVPVNSNIEGSKNVKVDGTDSVAEEVGLDNTTAAGETLSTSSPKDGNFKDNAEPASTVSDTVVEDKLVDGKEVSAAESKDQILASDAAVSDVQDENQGNVTELDRSFKENAEPANTAGDNVVEAKFANEKEVSAAESKDQIPASDVVVSDVLGENQGSLNKLHDVKFDANDQIDGVSDSIPESIHENCLVSERGETISVDFDVVLDFKEGAPNVVQEDLSSVGNDECLKTDGDAATHMVHQNPVCSNEPSQMADEGDTAELNEDKGLNVDSQADTEENQRNTMSPSHPRDEDIVEADSGVHVNQPVITTAVDEVMDGQKVAISQVEAVDKVASEIPEQSLGSQGNVEIPALDASTENMDLTETSACPKAKTADVAVTEDNVVCNDPVVDSEVGFKDVEESGLPQNMEQDDSVKTVETSDHDANKLESINMVQNEVVRITSVSDGTQVVSVQTVEASNCDTYKAESINMVRNELSSITAVSDGTQVVSVQTFETSNHDTYKPESINMVPNEVASIAAVSDGAQVVSVQTVEASNHDIDKPESINVMPNEVASFATVSDSIQVSISPEITDKEELHVSTTNISSIDGGVTAENSVCDVATSSGEANKLREADDNSGKADGILIEGGHISETKPMDVEEENESDMTHPKKREVDSELGTEEPASETDKSVQSNEETVKSSSSLRMNQPDYLSPPENEGCFAVSDLVWGKVRSHPWWPGQIFDPADASEKAFKYYKKDSYLVAYFGDRTFAWNDASLLKPFRSHFSQIEKQSNSEAFRNAVDCALEEVSRRVELGLACSCIPKDAHWKIKTQVVDNAGIREESSRRFGVDQSSRAASFEPDKLLEYIIDLAPGASSGADRLDLVIAQAQLSAFCRFKGYRLPSEFPSSGDLLENDEDTEQLSDEIVVSHKRKHTPKDASESRKERSLTELMGDGEYSPDAECGRKRRALDPLAVVSDKRESLSAAKISTPTSQTPRPSFKIGECIRRVASQLTGSTSLVKSNNDEAVIDGPPKIYEHPESFSVDEMLSQLQLVAQDPKKGHNFQKNIHAFFLGFRNSIALNRRGRKKKSEPTVGGSGEEFEFDDVNDSYWTDRIVQNYSEEQLLHNSENGAGSLQVVPFGAEKSVKPGRKPNSRKRYSTGSYPTEAEEDESVKRRKQESSPAELILNFAERNFVPSEISLNKMFRRFGPLMESETEVDHESGRAKVIFKRGTDAEVARNSSEKFHIFGPALVNYQIGYSPLISVKIMPLVVSQGPEDLTF